MEPQLTPISKILLAFDETMGSMPESYVKQSILNCKKLVELYLHNEKQAIVEAFNLGEINIMNSKLQGVKYESGNEYYNQKFKKK